MDMVYRFFLVFVGECGKGFHRRGRLYFVVAFLAMFSKQCLDQTVLTIFNLLTLSMKFSNPAQNP